MPAEVTSVLRKAVLAGDVSKESGAMAYADLPVQLYPFRPLASRIWELRSTVTAYDAWYVALAQALDAPLATLDARLRGAPGPRCRWLFAPADA